MNKKFIFVIFFCLYICSYYIIYNNSVFAQDIYVYVNATDVNIRKGPALDTKVIEQLQKGEKLRVLDIRKDWYYVEYKNGKTGWIFKQFVTSVPGVDESPTPTVIPTIKPDIVPKEDSYGKIVFASPDGLKIISPSGNDVKKLTNNSGDNFPVWSPDGNKIAFINFRDDRSLYIINSDGTGRKKLTEKLYLVPKPEWSMTSSYLIFSSEKIGDTDNIFYIKPASGELKNLTLNEKGPNTRPGLSPNNNFIAFESRRDKNGEVYIMKPDGTEQKNLTNNPAEDIFSGWSPDGKYILFTSNRNSNYKDLRNTMPSRDIYVIKTDGSSAVNLTKHSSDDYYPVWSPDGNNIAFLSTRGEKGANILIMKPSGEKLRRVTDIKGNILSIHWAKDSSRILFELNAGMAGKLYTVKIDGTEKTYLTEGYSPDWSIK